MIADCEGVFTDSRFCTLQIQNLYELAGLYSKNDGRGDVAQLQKLVDEFNKLDPGDNIVVASSFSHMLNLGNLAEEVQIAYRRRVSNAKKGDIGDENSALTESDMEETFQRLVKQMKKTPQEIFDALKDQTVDLVLTAHPTQSVRRSLLQKHSRCVTNFMLKSSFVKHWYLCELIGEKASSGTTLRIC